MITLIKNEFKKIFKKKSFYIVSIIFLLYCVLTNVIYKNMNPATINHYTSTEVDVEELKRENETLNLNNSSELSLYVNNLTTIEIEELKKGFSTDTQKYIIERYYYNILSSYNYAKYHDYDCKEIEKTKEEMLEKIKENDWAYFVRYDIENIKNDQGAISKTDKIRNEAFIKLKEYRINNQIDFEENNYLHQALSDVENNLYEYINLKYKEKLTKDEEQSLSYLKEKIAMNTYTLENKVDAKSTNNLKGVLMNFANEFGLFILIYIIMVSGSIVSEEYNKGTIKYLLTKPYKRSTILTSKLLTILLFIPFVLFFMLLCELLIGGIILGFSSLNIPVVIYDSIKEIVACQNVFVYMLKSILYASPFYFVLTVFCFMLSTITSSTSAAITLSFMLYLVGNVIRQLALQFTKYKILRAFVSVHWDYSYLLDGSKNPYNFALSTSILIVIIYLVVMLCITYVFFNKKDVKNI